VAGDRLAAERHVVLLTVIVSFRALSLVVAPQLQIESKT
jgi:hypothetical protein